MGKGGGSTSSTNRWCGRFCSLERSVRLRSRTGLPPPPLSWAVGSGTPPLSVRLLATGGHWLLVQLAKIDPELSQVYIRHIRYRQDRYPARACIWAPPPARIRPTVPLPRELRA